MKGPGKLVTDINFILRLIEFVLCILGIIFYTDSFEIVMVLSFHGWLYLSFFYVVSYVCEEPNLWVEVLALGIYAVLMLITALLDLSKRCIMPFVLAGLLIADLVILVVVKR